MARLVKITYGSLILGKDQTDTSFVLADRCKIALGYTEFSITFDVVVRNATRSTFLTSEAALLAAIKAPDQKLEVFLGSTTRHTFDPAANTGFNARGTCAEFGSELRTANSAHYRCTITAQLPADLSGRDGRQTSTVTVEATPAGKRTVVIEGTYTALSSNSSYAQYVASVGTYCDGVISALGGTYNLISEGTGGRGGFSYDDQNKVLRFRRVYEEVFYRESLAGGDHASIKGAQINIDRTTPENRGPAGFNVRPLERLRASYSATIDRSVTDIKGLYESTVRPLLLAELQNVSGGTVVVVGETPSYVPTENVLRVVLDVACDLGGSFYSASLRTQDYLRHGKILVPVWSDDPYARDLYRGPATHVKTVTRFTVAKVGGGANGSGVADRFQIPVLAGFEEIEQLRDESREHVGVTGDGFEVAQVTHVFVFEKANLEGGGSGSAGGAGSRRTATTASLGPGVS